MLRWHSTPFRKRGPVRRKGTRRSVAAVQLAALEQLQSVRSLAEALETAQITGPWWGAGSCHRELLLKPCSIPHSVCGGETADLGLEKSTSIYKELWPVPSGDSLTSCRFQNSRLSISWNNFHSKSFFQPKQIRPWDRTCSSLGAGGHSCYPHSSIGSQYCSTSWQAQGKSRESWAIKRSSSSPILSASNEGA